MSTVQDIYELSPMQQGMLFHTLYAPETSIYFEQRHCLLEGTLDAKAFRQAWQQVCDRYDVLRSEFHWQETDKPLQVVYESIQLPWEEGDWQGLTSTQQHERLESFLISERQKGFELDQAPLMRCGLFQLDEKQYRFVWSYHHLLMDGWCNGVLIREVLAFYQAARRPEKAADLPPVKPYRNYIAWLQQQDPTAAEVYWRKTLAGFDAPSPLGIEKIQDRNTAAEKDLSQTSTTDSHREQQHSLSAELSKRLQTFAQASRLTLNTLCQGAWATVLSRYSDTQDVVFGITVSGRPPELSGVASMVGLFINTVPLRATFSEEDTVLPWLQALQQTQRDRETYSYSLLTNVQSWSNIPSGTPLFESLLVFENYPVSIEVATDSLESGLSLRDGQGYEQTNYPLTLVVIPGERIQLSVRYDSQRIPDAVATRLAGHIETILEHFIDHPEKSLSQISILTEVEQAQLSNFSQGDTFEISLDCVPQQFEKQVFKASNATAITFTQGSAEEESDRNSESASQSLTYQQLNQQANHIAHTLKHQGVLRGTRVGLCLERSIDMVASLLAILKVGATYVPLDPNHPAERTHYILKDAQIELLITTSTLAEQLATEISASLLYLDQTLDESKTVLEAQSSENILALSNPDDIAYILYTSGSTGQPKGVPISHRSLTNFLASISATTGITAQDKLLAVTTLGFDIAALEIFLPLVTGAQLVMTSHEITLDGEQLAAQLMGKSLFHSR
ncbi:MAG: condensation domain-containing protein [Cyanobacteria bacterium J06632_3]